MNRPLTPYLPCHLFWTGKQTSRIDEISIGTQASYGLHLMEQAGAWIALAGLSRLRHGQQVLILAGPGNNGGDALVAARILVEKGLNPQVCFVSPKPTKLSSSRQVQESKLRELLTNIHDYQPGCLQGLKNQRLMIIDGLLGLGLKGPIRAGVFRDCLQEVASLQPSEVIAIDLPSGVLADLWQQEAPLLPATVTVSFGAAKPAHLLAPSRSFCGEVLLRPIDFRTEAIQQTWDESVDRLAYLASDRQAKAQMTRLWQKLSPIAHKFTRGHVLVIGGSPGKWGAAMMSARAAAATGAGWVSLAIPQKAIAPIPALEPYLTTEELFADGKLDPHALQSFVSQRQVKSIIIGPGCMQSPLSLDIVEVLQGMNQQQNLILVLDAGALQGLSANMEKLGKPFIPERCLVTPHPGEWLKMGHGLPAISDLATLNRAREKFFNVYGCSLLYKSATPLSPQPLQSGWTALASSATHVGLARAGSGDLLAGIAAGMTLTGIPAYHAGVMAHQWLVWAAEKAASQKSPHGISPEDLLIEIQSLSH
ncbi:MAG: NAD(P)H-hydrate epimerase [Oligoflexus sp.]